MLGIMLYYGYSVYEFIFCKEIEKRTLKEFAKKSSSVKNTVSFFNFIDYATSLFFCFLVLINLKSKDNLNVYLLSICVFCLLIYTCLYLYKNNFLKSINTNKKEEILQFSKTNNIFSRILKITLDTVLFLTIVVL